MAGPGGRRIEQLFDTRHVADDKFGGVMQPPRESALSLIFLACSVLAVMLAVAFAWALGNLSLAGFFLAIAIAAAAFATIFWPDRHHR